MNILWVSANKFGYELLKEAVKIKEGKVQAVITLGNKTRIIM